jgi:hypothetical protein
MPIVRRLLLRGLPRRARGCSPIESLVQKWLAVPYDLSNHATMWLGFLGGCLGD